MKNKTVHLIAIILAAALLLPPDAAERAAGFSPARTPAVAASPAAPARTSGAVTVTLTTSGFEPTEVTVSVGSEVVWQNATAQSHELRSGRPYFLYLPALMRGGSPAGDTSPSVLPAEASFAAPDDSFGGPLPAGGSLHHTFAAPGRYPYFLASSPRLRGVVIVQLGDLPPDPVTVAPPVDLTVATDFASATAFLYTDPYPIQTGVIPGTMEVTRVAVLRGKVLQAGGEPLSGVRITVLDHPEYGQTLSRADGMFDLAVNGGGLTVLNYEKSGYLPAQRKVEASWRDYAWLPDVVLLAIDPVVTAVDLSQPQMQVAQGSVISDTDGLRQATILFPAGTQATFILPGGATQAVTSFHVRITEYTVGEQGPEAMPGELPPASGYTYAAEYSVDEAVAAGALNVTFSQPLIHYSHNFLGFAVGMAVPTGYYDRVKAQWVASDNGRVVKVVSIENGLARVDTDGDGTADEGSGLVPALTDAERARLATLYSTGDELWRVPVEHFTPWDCNWAYGLPDDARLPDVPYPQSPGGSIPDGPCPETGSIVSCESQVLGESAAVAGTPFRLYYSSDHTGGQNTLSIPLSGPAIPASLEGIDLSVDVAGRHFKWSFSATANQTYVFAWDGLDGYGRQLNGRQSVDVVIDYLYRPVYRARGALVPAFGLWGDLVTPEPARQQVGLVQRWTGLIGSWDAREQGLGGWDFGVHHAYDPQGQVLFPGAGGQRRAAGFGKIVTTAAGSGVTYPEGVDGWPATWLGLPGPTGIAIGADGTRYIADYLAHRVWRVTPDGIAYRLAGTGAAGYGGDEGPATSARLYSPQDLAVGPDGSLYIADSLNCRIRRVTPDGIIHTAAGIGCGAGDLGDGGPAGQARLNNPFSVGVASDGTLYIADFANRRVRRVGTDGIITTAAGNGDYTFSGHGGLATLAGLPAPQKVLVAPDGALYISTRSDNRIRRVGTDGVITTFAGNGTYGFSGDGGPATLATFKEPKGLALGSDGTLYVADYANNRVRQITPDGTISTILGTGQQGYGGDAGPSAAANVALPGYLAVGQDGSVYVGDYGNHRVRRLNPPLPGFSRSEFLIASEDGSEVYHFNASGRHLETLDALTRAVLYTFAYDGQGRLSSITDADGNVTAVRRDGAGNLTGVAGPYGQHTTLALDDDGYLASVADPAGATTQLTYQTGGLLATLTDARGKVHHYQYDSVRRLVRDEDPAGGYKTLARVTTTRGYTVTVTTALGRTSAYGVEELSTGGVRRTIVDEAGGRQELIITPGLRQVTYPDGTVMAEQMGPDPRFGMQAALPVSTTVRVPGLPVSHRTFQRSVTLAQPNDLLSLSHETDTLTVNGHVYTAEYAAATRTWTLTSPEGRVSTAVLDPLGRVTGYTPSANQAPITLARDGHGRLNTLTQGDQHWQYTYNAQGWLASRADAAGNQYQWSYDAAGRPVQATLPGGETYGFAYDATGNRTSVTVPNGTVYNLGYDDAGRLASLGAPGSALPLLRAYNLDRQVTAQTLPGGRSLAYTYDAGGRPIGQDYPEAAAGFGYAAGDGTDRAVLLSRTLAGGGGRQDIAPAYQGPMLEAATWSGLAQGQYRYAYEADQAVQLLSLVAGSDAVTVTVTRDGDGLPTGYGPFTLTRGGPGGLVTQIAEGATTTGQTYDSLARLAGRTLTAGGQQAYGLGLTYDLAGRVATKTESVQGQAHTYGYGYDADGQLLQVTRDGSVVESYAYDQNGNRTSRQLDGGPTEAASYDARDRLTQRGSTAYTFDAGGALSARGGDSFVYSTRRELLSATVGGQQVTYGYDALGRRVSRTQGGATTQYLYGSPEDALRVSAIRDGSGLAVLYYDEAGLLFAFERGGVRYRVAVDQVGSPRVVTDPAGQVVKVVRYDTYGNLLEDSSPGFVLPLGFAGGLPDALTGLVHFGFRDYEPASGRWTVADPVTYGGEQANLFAYAGSDPSSLRDPSGLFTIGGSWYAGFGGGASLSITGEGVSLCVEVGLGVGGGLNVDPFGDLAESGSSIQAEIALKAGPGSVGASASFDDCGLKVDPTACFGPYCMNRTGGSVGGGWDELGKGVGENLAKSLEHTGKRTKLSGFGLEGKIAGVMCHRW